MQQAHSELSASGLCFRRTRSSLLRSCRVAQLNCTLAFIKESNATELGVRMEQARRGVGSQTQQGLVAIGRRLSDPGFIITFLAMEARLVGVCSVAKVK